MEATYSGYDFEKSRARVDAILTGKDTEYTEHDSIPSRSELTFANGFYVQITVLFVDLRGSKELAENHTRPVLAKIYRSYISETVAVLKGNNCINEIYIEGDGVWAVFNTVKATEVESVVTTAAIINTLIRVLNVKFAEKGYSELKAGIGIEDGESLYIKAGYSGSGINEVVWIGKAVGRAAKLCDKASRGGTKPIMITKQVYKNLSKNMSEFFTWSATHECYMGNVLHAEMDDWVEENE